MQASLREMLYPKLVECNLSEIWNFIALTASIRQEKSQKINKLWLSRNAEEDYIKAKYKRVERRSFHLSFCKQNTMHGVETRASSMLGRNPFLILKCEMSNVLLQRIDQQGQRRSSETWKPVRPNSGMDNLGRDYLTIKNPKMKEETRQLEETTSIDRNLFWE
jgi:hypothetical protein